MATATKSSSSSKVIPLIMLYYLRSYKSLFLYIFLFSLLVVSRETDSGNAQTYHKFVNLMPAQKKGINKHNFHERLAQR